MEAGPYHGLRPAWPPVLQSDPGWGRRYAPLVLTDLVMAGLLDQLGLMSALVFSLSASSSSLRNISLYPPCAMDSDCSAGHACMQYMCYPWHTSTGFRWCSKEEDCQDLTEAEEGDGRDGLCFRHPDTQRIRFGICLKKM